MKFQVMPSPSSLSALRHLLHSMSLQDSPEQFWARASDLLALSQAEDTLKIAIHYIQNALGACGPSVQNQSPPWWSLYTRHLEDGQSQRIFELDLSTQYEGNAGGVWCEDDLEALLCVGALEEMHTLTVSFEGLEHIVLCLEEYGSGSLASLERVYVCHPFWDYDRRKPWWYMLDVATYQHEVFAMFLRLCGANVRELIFKGREETASSYAPRRRQCEYMDLDIWFSLYEHAEHIHIPRVVFQDLDLFVGTVGWQRKRRFEGPKVHVSEVWQEYWRPHEDPDYAVYGWRQNRLRPLQIQEFQEDSSLYHALCMCLGTLVTCDVVEFRSSCVLRSLFDGTDRYEPDGHLFLNHTNSHYYEPSME